ncbi:hypothetical protein ES705_31859 [subsurface metagenome]
MQTKLLNKDTENSFPINPFPDVNPQEFNKLNKKRVTEDFVSENFIAIGWEVFEPFTDTGIDRIITKKICPNNHTSLFEDLKEKCPICKSKPIEITRYVQVKTRALKKGIFGFTLKSKDIRIDPRHVFVLYCDTTIDFLILPIFDYLNFFKTKDMNPFAPTSFRKGNYKLNSLRYNFDSNHWSWGRHSWESYRNIDGLKRIQNPSIDLNIEAETIKTRELSNEMLTKFSAGGSYPRNFEEIVNKNLQEKLKKNQDKKNVIRRRESIIKELLVNVRNPETKESVNKYWETIKNLEFVGEEES